MPRSASGFTLLELLAVLVLVSLIAGILMQTFSFALQLRSRFLGALEDQRVEILQRYWFRSLVSGVVSLPSTADDIFRGSATEMRGVSLNALDADVGIPAPFALRFRERGDKTELQYTSDGENDLTLARWTRVDEGFLYLDAGGEWHADWPPDGLDPIYQIPAAVRFSWSDDDRQRVWLVRLRNDQFTKRQINVFGN